jgi:hypothetical protein
LIRQRIIRFFLERGTPIPLTDLATDLGLPFGSLEVQLRESERLSDLNGLEVRQANELIRYYGEDVLFTTDVVETVKQYVLVRRKLDAIEKKMARKKDGTPPDPDKSSSP